MPRATFIIVLAVAVLFAPRLAPAASSNDQPIYDALESVVDAQFAHDFPRLASLLHPASLHLFRNALSARFDQLLRHFPAERIAAISGLADHPKNLKLSDTELFIAACNAAKERHPDFAGNLKFLPLNYHGTIFEGDKTAFVLCSYSNSVHTERTDFDYVQPNVFHFQREGDRWLLYSCILARRVIDDWWRDLSQLRDANQTK